MTKHSKPTFLWTALAAAALAATFATGCGGGPSVSTKDKGHQGTGGSAGDTGEGGEGTGGSSIVQPPPDCVPKTCEELEKDCGAVADGCGDIIQCGDCSRGHVCGLVTSNVCSTDKDIDDLCHRISKEDACDGKECGSEGDGCGGTYDCGTCGRNETCGIEEPFMCGTTPGGGDDDCPAKIPSCADVDAECGIIGNGCGGTIDCEMETGGCDSGEVCGLGGPQKCGSPGVCTPLTPAVACAGKCGIVSNGCGVEVNGGIIDCSMAFPCPSGQTCGGGGTPNTCGAPSSTSCMPIPQATACAGKTCGRASDGCTGSYACGTGCTSGQTCIAGACQSGMTCTPTPMATACMGKECGQVSNGCTGTYDCGMCLTGESCGLRTAYTCDASPGSCTPRTPVAACAGKQCGIAYDGCGTAAANRIDCGAVNGGCTAGQFCGLTTPFQCGSPTTPPCTPTANSCAALGWACGTAINNCGQTFNCASEGRSCGPFQTCTGGVTGPTTCSSGSGSTCALCGSVPSCAGRTQLTEIKGKVVTPGKSDTNTPNQIGVPNAFVYILQTNNVADLPAIVSGIGASPALACERCTTQDLGPVLVSAMTNATGDYTLSGNIPVGTPFILVVKVGKFRRAIQHPGLPANAACTTTTISSALPANLTRLPRDTSDGLTGSVNIPKIAVATGEVDAMECVLQKMGVANGMFTRPSGSGRVHLYRANGAYPDANAQSCAACGTGGGGTDTNCRTTYCGGGANSNRTNTLNGIADLRLLENSGTLPNYDIAVFDCEGGGWDSGFAQRDTYGANIINYVNRGGRMFASHWSYSWIDNGTQAYSAANALTTGLNPSATWTTQNPNDTTGTGVIARGRPQASPRIQQFTDWALGHGITTAAANYSFSIAEPRSQATVVGTSSEEFVYRSDGNMRTQQFSFNTPYASGSANACGRVAYSGFHVVTGNTSGQSFPNHCTGDLSNQEKVLLYMLFDLGGCVGQDPTPPNCTPQACPANKCGTQPNGCGGTQQCGCSAGNACINGTCQPQGCTPTTCAAEGIICSTISDGCGGSLTCSCPVCTPIPRATACAGKTCGTASDGCAGTYDCGGSCGPSCTRLTACPTGVNCGVISDNCDGTINCGVCTPPMVCGGAGQANRCGVPMCDPLTCDDQDAECGMVGNGCGGSVDCGMCPPGQVCTNAGGMPNHCVGCQPIACDDVGAECGLIGDGCGGTVDCGACRSGKICGAESPNKCGDGPGCTPLACDDVGAECGIVGDGCGGQVDCGPCRNGQVCGIQSPFECGDPPGCTPATCESAGAECGLIGDGCGDLVDCGNCPSGLTCGLSEANKCAGVR